MDDQNVFFPPKTRGLILYGLVVTIFISLSILFFDKAMKSPQGNMFLLLLVSALLLAAPIPFLAYRIYALVVARYTLMREGLRLRWGLRFEDVPLHDVEWIRPANELGTTLSLPWLSFPGGVLGVRKMEGIGTVEFMASEAYDMLLIATSQRIFAISPENPQDFMRVFHRSTEMGSLLPMSIASVYPTFLLTRVWQDRLARLTILCGFGLGILLLVIVSIIIPGLDTVSLGFSPSGEPLEPIPGIRLVLLPALNLIAYLTDLFTGLFFYRRPDQQPIAYLLWGSSVLLSLLLLVGLVFILTA